MTAPLGCRTAAEAIGTGLLVAVVVGSGIQATELSRDVGVQLLAHSLATVFGLGVLIALFGPVSGAHFNPAVTLAAWLTGRRDPDGLTLREVAAYVPAQIAGAIGGAILADAMFAEPLVKFSTHDRSAGHLWLGEVVATAGLLLLIFGLTRTGRAALAPAAVASYIGAAYWFTSSMSFANPAVTIGRTFTDTFAGIAPASVAPFIAAQLLGAALGVGLVAAVHGPHTAPRTTRPTSPTANPNPTPPDHTPEKDTRMSTPASRPSVLFVCVHNAGRSQMAARLPHPPRGRPHRGPLRRLRPRRHRQPCRGRGDGRGRHRTATSPLPAWPSQLSGWRGSTSGTGGADDGVVAGRFRC